jgi:hypothetical protein
MCVKRKTCKGFVFYGLKLGSFTRSESYRVALPAGFHGGPGQPGNNLDTTVDRLESDLACHQDSQDRRNSGPAFYSPLPT